MKGKRFLRGWLFGVWVGLVFLGLPNEVPGRPLREKSPDASKRRRPGEAIVGAVVVIDEIQRGGVTDEDGDYFIIDVPPGEYSITASMIGYEKFTIKSVQVNIDRTVSVDFALETAAIEVEGVVVEMEREVVPMDVSASQAVVTGEEMSQQVSKNVIEALSLEPAVYNGQVRGGGTDETPAPDGRHAAGRRAPERGVHEHQRHGDRGGADQHRWLQRRVRQPALRPLQRSNPRGQARAVKPLPQLSPQPGVSQALRPQLRTESTPPSGRSTPKATVWGRCGKTGASSSLRGPRTARAISPCSMQMGP